MIFGRRSNKGSSVETAELSVYGVKSEKRNLICKRKRTKAAEYGLRVEKRAHEGKE